MINVLITGANSYIGASLERRLAKDSRQYAVYALNMHGSDWQRHNFSQYDVVFHTAGIAHSEVEKASESQKEQYYKVNTELAVNTAKKAKAEGVKQFIFMSSMIIYSGCKETVITKDTKPKPLNFYGDSKWQADIKIRELENDKFKVAVLRPPMVYGKGSKGNYPTLAGLASSLPVFFKIQNRRSMIYIDNLCEFIKLIIDNCERGVFFPQNGEYSNTSEIVKMIAEIKGHKILMLSGFNWAINLIKGAPGKIGAMASKAFGSFVYDMKLSDYKTNYRIYTLKESLRLTEA